MAVLFVIALEAASESIRAIAVAVLESPALAAAADSTCASVMARLPFSADASDSLRSEAWAVARL
jgi:hypothetical protein